MQIEAGAPGDPNRLIVAGPTLPVQIGFDPSFRVNTTPNLPETTYPALVDTGATESCIDSNLARLLNLPIVDTEERSGIGGREVLDMYLAQIRVPELNITVYGEFAGVHLSAGGQQHLALMGRTFLVGLNMFYSGTTGSVILTKSATS